MTIYEALQFLVDQNGSDIHIIVGSPLTTRIDGELKPMEGAPVLTDQLAHQLIDPLLSAEQQAYIEKNKELDFGYQFEDKGRFRINVYHTKDGIAAALRLIPARIKPIDELGLPPIMHKFTEFKQGLVLLTGPTGEGKSTTLAAMIDEINEKRAEHIHTIEDPIEFVYTPKKSLVSQREVGQDTNGWEIALRSTLREDPDIVLVGEMRDYETIASTITIAETGHLVFATLHTSSAAETIDRIIDVFPAHQQGQVRQQLAETLKVVASQRLLRKVGGGRVAALEIMVNNPAIKNLIREQKTHQINTIIQTSTAQGMTLIENHLAELVQAGQITVEEAMRSAFRKEELERLLGTTAGGGSSAATTVAYDAHHAPVPTPAAPPPPPTPDVAPPPPDAVPPVTARTLAAPPEVPDPISAPARPVAEPDVSQLQAELNAAAEAVGEVAVPDTSQVAVGSAPIAPDQIQSTPEGYPE